MKITAGMYDHESHKVKKSDVIAFGMKTVSINIFKWIPRVSVEGLKKTSCVIRVKGKTEDFDQIKIVSNMCCKLLNSGTELRDIPQRNPNGDINVSSKYFNILELES